MNISCVSITESNISTFLTKYCLQVFLLYSIKRISQSYIKSPHARFSLIAEMVTWPRMSRSVTKEVVPLNFSDIPLYGDILETASWLRKNLLALSEVFPRWAASISSCFMPYSGICANSRCHGNAAILMWSLAGPLFAHRKQFTNYRSPGFAIKCSIRCHPHCRHFGSCHLESDLETTSVYKPRQRQHGRMHSSYTVRWAAHCVLNFSSLTCVVTCESSGIS